MNNRVNYETRSPLVRLKVQDLSGRLAVTDLNLKMSVYLTVYALVSQTSRSISFIFSPHMVLRNQ